MKKSLFSLLFFALTSFMFAQSLDIKTSEIKITSSIDDVKNSVKNEALTMRFTYSLNMATKKSIKQMAIKKFKSLAGSKGYTHLYIDEAASNKKQHEIRKRNYTVLMVGSGYK